MIRYKGVKWEGAKVDEAGDIVCAECGGKEFKTYMHLDYSDKYIWMYTCVGCKNDIVATHRRRGMNKKLWGDM